MDAEYAVVEQMAIFLVPDICSYIMKLVEDHHINLGLIKWKNYMILLNREYKSKFGQMYDIIYPNIDDPEDGDVVVLSTVHFGGKEPPEFGHDYSCRMFNHRNMIDSDDNSEQKGVARSPSAFYCNLELNESLFY